MTKLFLDDLGLYKSLVFMPSMFSFFLLSGAIGRLNSNSLLTSNWFLFLLEFLRVKFPNVFDEFVDNETLVLVFFEIFFPTGLALSLNVEVVSRLVLALNS